MAAARVIGLRALATIVCARLTVKHTHTPAVYTPLSSWCYVREQNPKKGFAIERADALGGCSELVADCVEARFEPDRVSSSV